MKHIASILFFISVALSAANAFAQGNTFVKYYDGKWAPVEKEKAVYYTEFVKHDTLYQCTSRYMASGKLQCTSTYADTGFIKGAGLLKRYYETGVLQDSILFF